MSSNNKRFYDVLNPNDFTSHRKPLIEKIGKRLEGTVIAYTASPYHPLPLLSQQDIPFFDIMIKGSTDSENCFLILSSPGGDGNVAEKIIIMFRQYFKHFTVIVPNYAKSAATMIALGSDQILMGSFSELGPIDPQLILPGYATPIPAESFVDGLEIIRKRIIKNKDPVDMYIPALHNVRPEILAMSQAAITNAKDFAEKYLKKFMLKKDPKQAIRVARLLSNGKQYKSHGQVIDFNEAKNVLKLNASMIDPSSQLWEDIWELYLRSIQLLMVNQAAGAAKLFESVTSSFVLNLQVQVIQRPPVGAPSQPPQVPSTIPKVPAKPEIQPSTQERPEQKK
jgi:ClpP class serine protease